MPIAAHDLMDLDEVAAAFGVTGSSLRVALSKPDTFPALANRLPAPIRRVGRSWVWARTDVEAAVKATPVPVAALVPEPRNYKVGERKRRADG